MREAARLPLWTNKCIFNYLIGKGNVDCRMNWILRWTYFPNLNNSDKELLPSNWHKENSIIIICCVFKLDPFIFRSFQYQTVSQRIIVTRGGYKWFQCLFRLDHQNEINMGQTKYNTDVHMLNSFIQLDDIHAWLLRGSIEVASIRSQWQSERHTV